MQRSPKAASTYPLWRADEALILASASAIRAQMLSQAGIPVDVRPAEIDERALESDEFRDPVELAVHLARAKALAVSRAQPGRVVLGADQVLALDDDILHKARDRAGALAQLARLSNRRHHLHSAACLVRDGEILSSPIATAGLIMRALSPAMIEAYVDASLPDILSSVGCYQIEAVGIQLFSAIEGDHFTIQGLPLLPVLDSLRRLGMLAQ